MNAPGIGAARFIGQRLPRKEDARLLTGKGTYVDDVILPGMLHCAFVRSPVARGRIVSVDTAVARAQPGVVAVLLAQDLARFPVVLHTFYMTPAAAAPPPLAGGWVAYVGDPVALVVASDRYLAEDAASLVEVVYAEEDPVVTIGDAKRMGPIHPGMESNVAAVMGVEEDEELEAVLAGAAHVVTHTVTHQRIAQSPMETRGLVAQLEGEDLTLHFTCQSPHLAARYTALALGMPALNVRVLAKDVGGSFGLKNHPWREEMAVICAALLLKRPLKWIEDRWENLVAANQAREQECTVRIAFDAQGRLLAGQGDYGMNNGAYPQGEDANIAVHMFMWAAYKMPAYGFYTRGWYTNTVGLAAYRGPWAMESLVRETLLDVAARRIGVDPIELRRRNLLRLSDQPTTTSLGLPLEDVTPAECLDTLLETLDVPAFRAEQARAREAGRHLGLGIAAYIEPTASTGSIGVMTGETAQLRVDPSGKVVAVMSTFSQGHGTQTTMAQCIAEQMGVPFDDVIVHEGDSARGAFGPGAAGSRQGVVGGGAALKAAGLLADKVKAVAAHLLNAPVADVTLEDGVVRVAGVEEMTRPLREIAEIAWGEPHRLPPEMQAGLEAQYRYTPPPMTYTSAAHACIVEVDAETGMVKILRWLSSEDCGVMINPAVVEGQIAGGLAQGIGSVLLEEISYDARGTPTAVTFKDYSLPSITDVPDFEYVHASTPSKAEGGFRGVGEGGAIIGPPTLVNAIADALSPFGELKIELPLTPAKLLGMIEGRDLGHRNPSSNPPAHAASPTGPERAPVSQDAQALPAVGDLVLPGGGVEAASHAGRAEPAPAAAEGAPPVAVDGQWRIVLASPVGPQPMVATFATDGARLSGRLDSDQGSQDFTGTAEGGRLLWELKVDKPMKLTLKYDVLIEGDALRGTCKMGFFGAAKLTGERA